MDALFTIGHNKTSLRGFVERLQNARVDCVVDIRLNNTSQLAGFAKRDDLEFLLVEGFGIRYVHMLNCAPAQEMLDAYKSDRDWDRYAQSYGALIDEREMPRGFLDAARAAGWKRPCLLCAEETPDTCHRRLLAEALAAAGSVEVTHL